MKIDRNIKLTPENILNNALGEDVTYNDSVSLTSNPFIIKGSIGCNSDCKRLPDSHKIGDAYLVSGNSIEFKGNYVLEGDCIVCIKDGHEYNEDDWVVLGFDNISISNEYNSNIGSKFDIDNIISNVFNEVYSDSVRLDSKHTGTLYTDINSKWYTFDDTFDYTFDKK